jgi:hypothetical protein
MPTAILLVSAHIGQAKVKFEANGSAILSVTDSCRDTAVITRMMFRVTTRWSI